MGGRGYSFKDPSAKRLTKLQVTISVCMFYVLSEKFLTSYRLPATMTRLNYLPKIISTLVQYLRQEKSGLVKLKLNDFGHK